MAEASTRSIKPATIPASATPPVDEKPDEQAKKLSPKGENEQELAQAARIKAHHREIFTAMCANINPEAMTSGVKITQTIAHIRGISQVAANAFENPAVRVGG